MNILPELSAEEVERYARHILLRDIGGPGQRKLKAANVCVVGAGGLGAPLLLYLAAAGVGALKIIDDDAVSLSNLQRQILFADERHRAAQGGVCGGGAGAAQSARACVVGPSGPADGAQCARLIDDCDRRRRRLG